MLFPCTPQRVPYPLAVTPPQTVGSSGETHLDRGHSWNVGLRLSQYSPRKRQTACLFLQICNFGSSACLCARLVCADEPLMQWWLSCNGPGRSATWVLLRLLYLLLPLHSFVWGQIGLLSHTLTVRTVSILAISRINKVLLSWRTWISSYNLWEARRLEPAILFTVHPFAKDKTTVQKITWTPLALTQQNESFWPDTWSVFHINWLITALG